MARTVPAWVRKPAPSTRARAIQHGYRSGLEEKIAAQIEEAGLPVLFESFKVPYEVPAKLHSYTPDFLLPNGIIVESKGIFDATDRAKHLFIKAQYPELDIRFVFSRSKAPIGPGAKTRLDDWCRQYGYTFADKLIPPEWFTEPGPATHPHAVLAAGPFAFARKPGRPKGPR